VALGALLGMVLHMTWHVVDGADGDLARLTGRTSPMGELVDGICDYAGHVALYILLVFVLGPKIGYGWAWFWALFAGASHVAQANFVEVQRRFYQYWTYGVPGSTTRRRTMPPCSRTSAGSRGSFAGSCSAICALPRA
jgi:phosphatidylglycerophosphate synthase